MAIAEDETTSDQTTSDQTTTETHTRTCPLCEAMCGLRITVEAGQQVKLIRANQDDVWSKGYLCPKGTTLGHMHHDPDRLTMPMIRTGDSWREATWPEAFAECERLIRGVVETHGKEAFTAYIGNPTVHNYSLSRYVGAFTGMSGISPIYSAGTVDQWPKNVSSALLYGNPWVIPTPDLDRTDMLVIMGANPQASQGSLLAAADVLGRCDAIRERGGTVVVVDPRRTGTVDHADEWLPIRPGTDAALLLAVINVFAADELIDLGRMAEFVDGVDVVVAAAADFTPEAVAETCAIPADRIRRLAHQLAEAPTSVVYGRIGTCNQEFGSLASWLVDVVNMLTGNFDRPGGLMFSSPMTEPLAHLPRPSQNGPDGRAAFGRWTSRVRGAPEVLGQVPVSCMAEEIDTPGEGQLHGLITIAGNPVLSAPESARLAQALPMLDCMISIDNWLNETTKHAHVILPGQGHLEQSHCDEMIWSWAIRNAAKWSPALFPPPDDHPREWEVLLTVAGLFMGAAADEIDTALLDDLFFGGVVGTVVAEPTSPIHGRDQAEIVAATPGRGPDRLADFSIRRGVHGDHYGANPDGWTLARLQEHPDGVDLGPLESRLPELLQTPDGRIDIAPAYLLADLPRLHARLGRSEDGLVLVSRRHLRSNNSWMHNIKVLVKGKDRCTLMIHPDDAEAAGVTAGAKARVSSESGEVEIPVEVTDEMMPGVVSLPHGWGHDVEGTRLSVAREHAGVNSNLLAPGHLVDPLSGNAIVNGIPVEVTPAG